MSGSFLPSWPPTFNGFLVFGMLIVIGLLGGRLAQRTGYLPRITGFIVIGFVLGPGVGGLITEEMLGNSQVFVDIALGLILFQLGRLLDVPLALRDRPLLAASMLEAGLSFAALFGVLELVGVPTMQAAVAAAIGISSSPAVVLLVVRELGAAGPLTERVLFLVAMNNLLAFLAYTALLPFIHFAHNAGLAVSLLDPLYRLGASITVAAVLAWSLLQLVRWLPRDETTQFALLIGVIIGAIGLAKIFNASSLLTLLMLGIFTHNLDRKRHVLPVEFGHGGEVFFVVLFVVAGAKLRIEDVSIAGLSAVMFVLARFAGKCLGVMVLARGVADLRQAGLTALTLVPMAGMAIGLTQSTAQMYPQFAATLSPIVLGAIAILETLGPIATEFALKRSGEVRGEVRVEH
jgi:Kef-type K+ transport system membrane component KefB